LVSFDDKSGPFPRIHSDSISENPADGSPFYFLKLSALLILSWLFLTVVGYAARVHHRFTVGWSMVRGHRVSNALRYL
jgi:hypothetical protein